MKKTINAPVVPTANLAINKSRIKLYKNAGDMPTYYLQKGQEFSIELFNPTSDTVLAKIFLNNKPISQGGLILKPGQRVFLERYLDVAKKFLFDTYEVANTSEVKKAIENNGDFKVQFYRENQIIPSPIITFTTSTNNYNPNFTTGTPIHNLVGSTTTSNINSYYNSSNTVYCSSLDDYFIPVRREFKSAPESSLKTKKSIETGRVEMGSDSDQEFETVNKSFEYFPFHTIECKMLPVSQKINTVDDIQIKVYCTNCGSKLGKTDKFCSNCGSKK
jgi:hypothetical protein